MGGLTLPLECGSLKYRKNHYRFVIVMMSLKGHNMWNSNNKAEFLSKLIETNGSIMSKKDIRAAAKDFGEARPQWLTQSEFRSGHGKYDLSMALSQISGNVVPLSQPVAQQVFVPSNPQPTFQLPTLPERHTESLIPEKDPNFVKFGFYNDLRKILESKMFYPVFITGLSGNGKTYGSQQLCAQLKRECITVPITIETDESDLLGDKTLIDGNVIFSQGPVVDAMERGAVLILDEVDLASNKIMCLQSIIDGKGVYLKKDNRFVKPAAGFTVIATANTKGKGSDDGRFIGTNVMNEAFLERFKITFEQEYPSPNVEKKILKNTLSSLKEFTSEDEKNVDDLTVWASAIRKTFEEGGIDEVISTRRLVHIVETFHIFGKISKSIELCTNRFDEDTKASFVDLFEKISGGEEIVPAVEDGEEVPF